jgi:hypothetical protein
LPATQSGVVSNVIDGRTVVVELAETGQSERIRLIGIGDPSEDATSYLSSFIGQSVMLERDPAHPDDNRLLRYVWVTDENGMPSMVNALLIENGSASYESNGEIGRFDAMLAMAEGLSNAVADVNGSAPQSPTPSVEVTEPAALTEADRAYLAELMRSRDNYRLSMEYYDLYMTDPTFDGEFYGHLMAIVLGWSVFDEGIGNVVPTPRFADLHARYLAAIAPFDALAYRIEPALDQMLAGETPGEPFAGFDYDDMTSTVAAARPELEQVLAEIDAVLEGAGIVSEAGPIR